MFAKLVRRLLELDAAIAFNAPCRSPCFKNSMARGVKGVSTDTTSLSGNGNSLSINSCVKGTPSS